MEAAVVQLEESVSKADKKLDVIAWKLDHFEKQVVHVDGSELGSEQLQKQLSDSLRVQLRQVQGTFGTLRNKIIGGSQQN
ncbi:hypothetical protein C0J52_15317 [Blattella germanica]|nr:hypothetical protein C0J52_15317 [Blattella germanica]